MVQIIIMGQKHFMSEAEYQRLCLLLPYWGLILNKKSEVLGKGLSRHLSVSGLSPRTLSELRGYLAHTGLDVSTSDIGEFIVTYDEGNTAPISIRILSVSYQFHPANTTKIKRVQDYIYKELWLPKRSIPIHISIHPEYRARSAEWLTYLMIQYMSLGKDFQDLSIFTLEDYQAYVSKYLLKINARFARLEQDAAPSNTWPTFPRKAAAFRKNETKSPTAWDFDKTQDAENDLDFDFDFDVVRRVHPFFHHRVPSEPQPINPFKKEVSEQSIINPFHSKNKKE